MGAIAHCALAGLALTFLSDSEKFPGFRYWLASEIDDSKYEALEKVTEEDLLTAANFLAGVALQTVSTFEN